MIEDEEKTREEKEAQTDMPSAEEIGATGIMKAHTGLPEILRRKSGEKGQKGMTKQQNDQNMILQSFYAHLTAIMGKYLLAVSCSIYSQFIACNLTDQLTTSNPHVILLLSH